MAGGGGTSGKVAYPVYMEGWHSQALNDTGGSLDELSVSLTDVMEDALVSNPYAGFSAFDPDFDLNEITTLLAAYNASSFASLLDDARSSAEDTSLGRFDPAEEFNDAARRIGAAMDSGPLSSDVSNDRIAEDLAAFTALYDDDFDSVARPRFEAGASDMDAVMSSAFAVGRALLERSRARDLAKHQSDIRLHMFDARNRAVVEGGAAAAAASYQRVADIERIAQSVASSNVALAKDQTLTTADVRRLRIAAKVAEGQEQFGYEEAEAQWKFEVFREGGNFLGAIGGGMRPNAASKINRNVAVAGTALQRGFEGAALGAGFGPIGAAIGGVLGLVGGGFEGVA